MYNQWIKKWEVGRLLKGKDSFYAKYVKRVLDIFFSSIALLVLGIPMLTVALLIKIDMGSPVLFKQERIGKDEKKFTLLKFRSMKDAFDQYGVPLPDEKRITKLGKIIRKLSVDELPSLLNIWLVSYCTANDYSFKNQYMTNSGIAPADNGEEAVKTLIPETERIASLLGLVDGQLHMQYITDNSGKTWIIEMMRRNIGNNWMTMITDTIGVNWPEWCIRAEAGMDCRGISPARVPDGYHGYYSAQASKNGIIKGYQIAPEFEKYIYQTWTWKEPGEEIKDYLREKVASFSFYFKTKEEKEHFIPILNDMITVEMV